jgi:hypothetical protein
MSLGLLALIACGGDEPSPDAGVVGNNSTRREIDVDRPEGSTEGPEDLVAKPAVDPLLDPMRNGGVVAGAGVGAPTEAPPPGSTDPWVVYSPVSVPLEVASSGTGNFDWPFSTKGQLKEDAAQEAVDVANMQGWKVPPSQMIDDEEKSAAYVKRLKQRGVNTEAIAAAHRRMEERKKEREE